MSKNKRDNNITLNYDWKNGTLYRSTTLYKQVLHPWPNPQAWLRYRYGSAWRPFHPQIRIPDGPLGPRIRGLNSANTVIPTLWNEDPLSNPIFGHRDHSLKFCLWADHIPLTVRNLITPFAGSHWNMLLFLAIGGKQAQDLTGSNPALAMALASSRHFRPHRKTFSIPTDSGFLRKKQTAIMEELGFPATKVVRRILQKMHPSVVTIRNLLRVRHLLLYPHSENILRVLCHIPGINRTVLELVCDPIAFHLVSPKAIIMVAQSDIKIDHITRKDEYINECYELLNLIYPDGYPKNLVNDIHDFYELNERLVRKLDKVLLRREPLRFPAPPFESTPYIIPITHTRELAHEVNQQKHCAGKYLQDIWKGNSYLYRIIHPERCTLAIHKTRDHWRLTDLRAYNNRPVSPNTVLSLRSWLVGNGMFTPAKFEEMYWSIFKPAHEAYELHQEWDEALNVFQLNHPCMEPPGLFNLKPRKYYADGNSRKPT